MKTVHQVKLSVDSALRIGVMRRHLAKVAPKERMIKDQCMRGAVLLVVTMAVCLLSGAALADIALGFGLMLMGLVVTALYMQWRIDTNLLPQEFLIAAYGVHEFADSSVASLEGHYGEDGKLKVGFARRWLAAQMKNAVLPTANEISGAIGRNQRAPAAVRA